MGSWFTWALLALLLVFDKTFAAKRSIDLIAAHSLISDGRLPREVTPNSYRLDLQPFPEEGYFTGRVRINVTWQDTSDMITLHAHQNLEILSTEITQFVADDDTERTASTPTPLTLLKLLKIERVPKKPIIELYLERKFNRGTQCEIDMSFKGKMFNDTSEGMFRHSYKDSASGESKWYVATHFRPNMARTVFPCFDEPAYKVPFIISVTRKADMSSLSNMPLESSAEEPNKPGWYIDRFLESPPMSTFTVGIVVSNLTAGSFYNKDEEGLDVEIRVFGRLDYLESLKNSTQKIVKSLRILQNFWGVRYPLPKLDCLALPNYQATKPADNWGLILFKESELSTKTTWPISQELVYQWLGAFATPFWWSDAHINNALAKYLTAYTVLQLKDSLETFNNWPMTMLYSIYYEFSKRYPHGKNTAIKQDSASAKTALVFRMLNYTLGEKIFKQGMQRFMNDRQFKTFFADDIWSSLTEVARQHKILKVPNSVNEIAGSWISKDRLPVINVTRNYQDGSATVSQRVYLRERPHDVPDQEKLLWWIPIVAIKEDNLNFYNTTPITWMNMNQRTVTIPNFAKPSSFVIVNPEEIGPFPVNYDDKNWNKLAEYLLNNDGRNKIPVNTRAKLLHDAWNLAYAGDLGFGVALNMTLFLKYEREYLAWDPVFTMIDHIGRHIDSSSVHKKFQTYVRLLLTPLYEELGNEPQDGESEGRAHLRSSSKIFLCQAGYKPCIEEAQKAFEVWMLSDHPDEGNPVANQYICPVFKWGSKKEWEFGLQRVINFPSTRKANERTYLLKTLAGCPIDSWKIQRLLNITVLEENSNFTDNDIYLIFSMLTGGASGYTTLFHFLERNWDVIKVRFENKPHLWNSLVTSATTVFKTQEGLDMVSDLYSEKQGKFGTAEFVVERALKNIKEETKWSNDNLPVIEKWLDNYLKDNQVTNINEESAEFK